MAGRPEPYRRRTRRAHAAGGDRRRARPGAAQPRHAGAAAGGAAPVRQPPPAGRRRRRARARSTTHTTSHRTMHQDLIIGIDAGTSVIKAVAFDLAGRQIAAASTPNQVLFGAHGAAEQDMERTWHDTAATLQALAQRLPNLAARTVALAATAQGDGTWLIDAAGQPVGPA